MEHEHCSKCKVCGKWWNWLVSKDCYKCKEDKDRKTLELIQELASLRPCKETAGVKDLVKKAKELLK